MLSRLLLVALLCSAVSGLALAQSGGIPPEWEVQKQMAALADHVQRVEPVLEQLKPEDWVKQGAPAAYTEQIKRTRAEIGYLIGSTKELSAHADRLTVALETYFRMQSVDAMLRSVAGGIRKYQNPALADVLQSLIAGTSTDREKLRQYVVDLAADREQQFRVADAEAQRCRAVLSKQPRPPEKTEKEERR